MAEENWRRVDIEKAAVAYGLGGAAVVVGVVLAFLRLT